MHDVHNQNMGKMMQDIGQLHSTGEWSGRLDNRNQHFNTQLSARHTATVAHSYKMGADYIQHGIGRTAVLLSIICSIPSLFVLPAGGQWLQRAQCPHYRSNARLHLHTSCIDACSCSSNQRTGVPRQLRLAQKRPPHLDTTQITQSEMLICIKHLHYYFSCWTIFCKYAR